MRFLACSSLSNTSGLNGVDIIVHIDRGLPSYILNELEVFLKESKLGFFSCLGVYLGFFRNLCSKSPKARAG